MSKHTSGPWVFAPKQFNYDDDQGLGSVVTDELHPTYIAKIEFDGSVNNANANLIAAAPDMYEALKNMYHAFQDGYDCTFDAKMGDAVQDAYVAFTKAEGK